MRHPSRLAAALLLLTLAAASARPARAVGSGLAAGGSVSPGSALLLTLWDQARCLLGAKSFCMPRAGWFISSPGPKLGCRMDSNGQCSAPTAGGEKREWGCTVDPNGKCIAPAPGGDSLDWGCLIDPDGKCIS